MTYILYIPTGNTELAKEISQTSSVLFYIHLPLGFDKASMSLPHLKKEHANYLFELSLWIKFSLTVT